MYSDYHLFYTFLSCLMVQSFASRTNLKLHNLPVTPKLVKTSHNQP